MATTAPVKASAAATPTARVARAPAAPRAEVVRLQVAGLGRQWLATVIDGVVGGAVVAGALRGGLSLADIKATPQGVVDTIHATPLALLPVLGGVVVALFLWQLVPVLLKASLGQKLVGLRLVSADGEKPGVARLLLRAVASTLTTLVCFAGPAWGLLVDGKRRSLGDVIAGTVAVRGPSTTA